MKNFKNETLLAITLLVATVIGIFSIGDFDFYLTAKIIAILILTLGGLGIYMLSAWKKKKDIENNVPIDDEMTMKIKVYAGNKSFHLSLYLWILIFIFHGLFHEAEAMLGIGILGPALIYMACLRYYKSTQNFKAPNL